MIALILATIMAALRAIIAVLQRIAYIFMPGHRMALEQQAAALQAQEQAATRDAESERISEPAAELEAEVKRAREAKYRGPTIIVESISVADPSCGFVDFRISDISGEVYEWRADVSSDYRVDWRYMPPMLKAVMRAASQEELTAFMAAVNGEVLKQVTAIQERQDRLRGFTRVPPPPSSKSRNKGDMK